MGETADRLLISETAWMYAAGAGNGRPHLAVSHGDVHVSFTPMSDQATDHRQLARQRGATFH